MSSLTISTNKKRQVIDITDLIAKHVEGLDGLVTLFVRHTTAAITLADLDPGTDLDFLDFLDSLVPNIAWRHPHDPAHAPDHLLASLIGPSVTIPYSNGKLLLGVWQRIVLVELNGPRDRELVVVAS